MKNIKATLLLIAILIFSFAAIAQPRIGVKGGINYSSLSGYEGKSLLSYHAGFFTNKSISKNWRIQPELLYNGEGQRFSTDAGEQTLSMQFVSVPVMLQYFPTGSFYIEAGPRLSVLTSAKSKESGSHFNLKRSFRSTDFGLNAGIGFSVSPQIGIYGRYHFGLTDMTLYDDVTDRIQSAQIGILISFKNNRQSEPAPAR